VSEATEAAEVLVVALPGGDGGVVGVGSRVVSVAKVAGVENAKVREAEENVESTDWVLGENDGEPEGRKEIAIEDVLGVWNSTDESKGIAGCGGKLDIS
jgi:hypothetical protein